ncbi:MAG: DUF1501 domain-containing protein [bacterium]|nr:DUF1501 domain-containing protein [bacterium]
MANNSNPLFLQVFLRGGADGLTFVPPTMDTEYTGRRNRTVLTPPGSGGTYQPPVGPPVSTDALPLVTNPDFGLSPALGDVKTLFLENKAIFVQACGGDDDGRSHFMQQDFVERGETSANQSTTATGNGWLGRHLASTPVTGTPMRALSLTTNPILSLRGAPSTTTTDPDGLAFPSPPASLGSTRGATLQTLYGLIPVAGASQQIIDAFANDETSIGELANVNFQRTPAAGTPTYPAGPFGAALKQVADIVDYQSGASVPNPLEIATIDYGGWDTHDSQGVFNVPNDNRMYGLMKDLNDGLFAFVRDMESQSIVREVVIFVLTEFGRTTDENTNLGTDHGRGGLAILLGSAGKIQSQHHQKVLAPNWSGLPNQGLDLDVATEFRDIQYDILDKVLCNPNPGAILHSGVAGSGYTHTPLNLLV